ncbi:MAG TPA: AI-2E family transporter [Pyrinomonadaceae bacterium]|nr:AI-2E family transporter [Pyrinomonadaceae bacterium]
MKEGVEKDRFNAGRLRVALLVVGAALAIYLFYLVALPFLTPLAWAAALAVLVFPLYRRINGFIKMPNVSSGLATLFVALAIVAPVIFAARYAAQEMWENARYIAEQLQTSGWRQQVEQNDYAGRALDFFEREAGLTGMVEQIVNNVPAYLTGFLSGSIWVFFHFLITFFALFFFFRDHEYFIKGIRRLLPLTKAETDRVFKAVNNTLFATVFGEVLIAALTGVLGGLLFWAAGLPAPVLWGFVMGLFGFLPAIGAWMVWLPAAVYLILQGRVVAGISVIVGGSLIMLLTTLLYPKLVGDRLELHTLLVFIAIIGGIIAFGTVGIILGPLALVMAITLIDILKKRASEAESAEGAGDESAA